MQAKRLYLPQEYTDSKEEIEINTRQLSQFIYAMCKLGAFSQESNYSYNNIDSEVILGNIAVDFEISGDEIIFQSMSVVSPGLQNKNKIYTDYPQSIKSIFGLDYELFVPVALECLTLDISITYTYEEGYWDTDNYDWNDPSDYHEAEVEDFEIKKVTLIWKTSTTEDKYDITDYLSPQTMKLLTEYMDEDTEQELGDYLNDR